MKNNYLLYTCIYILGWLSIKKSRSIDGFWTIAQQTYISNLSLKSRRLVVISINFRLVNSKICTPTSALWYILIYIFETKINWNETDEKNLKNIFAFFKIISKSKKSSKNSKIYFQSKILILLCLEWASGFLDVLFRSYTLLFG